MEAPEGLSLDDLARETGIEPRTIRAYVQRGLAPRPSKRGRGALYPAEALDRLRAIRRLMREQGLSLDDIGRVFFQADEDAIRGIADGRPGPIEASPPEAVHAYRPRPMQTRAVDRYESPFEESLVAGEAVPAESCSGERRFTRAGASSLESLLDRLRAASSGGAVRHGSRVESWVRVRVTPDFEIGVRGIDDPATRAQMEEIADHLRAALSSVKGVGRTD